MPSHTLSADERTELLSVANEPRFCAVPPARIVPMLADEGVYLASESTFARVLRGPRANSTPRPSQGTQSQTPADHPHRHDRTLGVKSRLFINSFHKQIRFFCAPLLQRLNRSFVLQSSLRDVVVVGF
jgi:hypothetical protein